MAQASLQIDEHSESSSDGQQSVGVGHVDSIPLPPDLGTTGSKLVYLYLAVVGKATMDDLNQTLDMKRLRLYPMLSTMQSDGLVDREGDTFRSLSPTRS